MALSVLNGQQTATTLSSVVTGGEHIVAHTVVSLGSVAISNISGAVSGSVVTIPNLNKIIQSVATEGIIDGTLNFIKIGGHQDGSNQTAHIVHVSSGGALKVDASGSTQPISGTVTANDFSEWQEISTRDWKADQSDWIVNVSQYSAIKLYVDGGNENSISNGFWIKNAGDIFCELDPIIWNGRSNVNDILLADCTAPLDANVHNNYVKFIGSEPPTAGTSTLYGKKTRVLDGLTNYQLRQSPVGVSGTVTASVSNSVTIGSLPAISGTVTASVTNSITVGSLPVQLSTTTIGGTARLNVTLSSATTVGNTAPSYANLYGGSDGTSLRAILTDTSGRTVVTGSLTVSQSGSTTIGALPSGALTTRFGSVTTANLAQISTAVTNASRKYLLAQNISAGTVTIGIGFSPTTTQGIQLTAGAGITFDTFCPTGAVYWLGATTGATFTILEG